MGGEPGADQVPGMPLKMKNDSWIKWQTDLWKNNSKIPIASAVAEWMYKLYDDTFPEIKNIPDLHDMILVNNSRLSVQPVTATEWEIITSLGN